jgi:hypothetical protein
MSREPFELHSSGNDKNQQNDENQTQSPARVVAPAGAVWPSWKCSQQEKDQEDQEYRAK